MNISNCFYQADEANALIRKSQIAIEYAYRVRDSAPQTWVFWVHGSNASRFKQAYTDIATRIELPGRNDPMTDILSLVYNWLRDERNGQWLIILDNADDDEVLHSTGVDSDGVMHGTGVLNETASLASFLPQSSNGQILVTSRDLVAALNLVGTGNVFRVEPMVEKEALMLLKTRISIGKAFENDAKTLVKRLGYIPLAITHAAAYIEVRAQTITTYLELFRESEENQAYLLSNQEIRDMRRDSSVSSAVITTWQISFEQIRKTKPSAAELLSLMAMFDRQGIPESILLNGENRLMFEDAVAPLTSFSLIKAQSTKQPEQQFGERLFEMHDLVQLATRKWLEIQVQVGGFQKASLRIMAASFPCGDYETWAACRVLLPHAKKVLRYNLEDREAILDQSTIAHNLASYLQFLGENAAAEEFVQTALIERTKVLGLEHINTLRSVNLLGSLLEGLCKYKEAETVHRRALEGYEKAVGEEHVATIFSISQLGLALQGQGKYKEAEAMYCRALKAYEKVGGEEHQGALASFNRLGLVLALQGRYKEAEAMHHRALEGYRKMFGEERRDTLTSVSKLGQVLEKQGKYEEAEAMQRRALEGLERIVGKDHLDALTGASELGSVLQTQGKYKEADEMHRRAVEGYKKMFGDEHPLTLVCIGNLASSLRFQGQWKKAEDLEMRVLEMRERFLGREHPDTMTAMINLSGTLKCQGRNKEAISLMETCFQLLEKVFGRHHPQTEASLQYLNEWREEDI